MIFIVIISCTPDYYLYTGNTGIQTATENLSSVRVHKIIDK